MAEWYYVREGKQQGPVSFESLRDLAQQGSLRPQQLVWNTGMKDWTPAAEVEGIFSRPIPQQPEPATAIPEAPEAPEAPAEGATRRLQDIEPGSEPIRIAACVNRAVELTKRNFGNLFLVGLVYVFALVVASMILMAIDQATGMAGEPKAVEVLGRTFESKQPQPSLLHQVLLNLFSFFLTIGATRITLDVVDGKAIHPNQLFGGGPLFLRALGASILFGLALMLCLLPLELLARSMSLETREAVSPGEMLALTAALCLGLGAIVHLSLRFGFHLFAIVDRGMGPIESLRYSAHITRGQRLTLLLLSVVMVLLVFAGLLCFLVGVVFTLPVAMLAWVVAYRWMQHGPQAAGDGPD